MNDQKNHRSSERINLALEIHYRSAGAFLMSYSVNLSRGGLFIETDAPLPPGTHLDLKLNTPDEETISLSGEVAWVRAPVDARPGSPPGMGISVQTPEDRYGALVDRIASRFRGIRILLAIGPGHDRSRSMLHRHLAQVVACEVVDVDDPFVELGKNDGDLAIISMDWMHGEDLLSRLGGNEPQIPVIALARRSEARLRARSLGAIAALENPPGYPDLRQAVIHALAAPSAVTS